MRKQTHTQTNTYANMHTHPHRNNFKKPGAPATSGSIMIIGTVQWETMTKEKFNNFDESWPNRQTKNNSILKFLI